MLVVWRRERACARTDHLQVQGRGRAHHVFEPGVRGGGRSRSSKSGPSSKSPAPDAKGAAKAEAVVPAQAPLPKQCDNSAALKAVVTKLDGPATPDDVRVFLADERFRLMRCEYTRFTADERRERDAA